MDQRMMMVLASVFIIPEVLAPYPDSQTLAAHEDGPVSVTQPAILRRSRFIAIDNEERERRSVTSPLRIFRSLRLPEFDKPGPYTEVNSKQHNRLKKSLTRSDILQLIKSGDIRFVRNTSTKKKKLEVLDSPEDEKDKNKSTSEAESPSERDESEESESRYENESHDDAESEVSDSVTESESTEDLESTDTERVTQNRQKLAKAAPGRIVRLLRHSGSSEYEDSAGRSKSSGYDKSEEEIQSTDHSFTVSSESASEYKITKNPLTLKKSTAYSHASDDADSAEISEETHSSENVQMNVMRTTKKSVNNKSTMKSETDSASGENSYESVDVSDSDTKGYESVGGSTRRRTPISPQSGEWLEREYRSSQSSEISTSSSANKETRYAVSHDPKHTESDNSQESSELSYSEASDESVEYTSAESVRSKKNTEGITDQDWVEESSLNDDFIVSKTPLSIILKRNTTNPVVIHKSSNSVYIKNGDIHLSRNPKHLILDLSTAHQKDVEKMLSVDSKDILTTDSYDLSAITIILDSPKERASPEQSENSKSLKIVVPEHPVSDEKNSDSVEGTHPNVKKREHKTNSSLIEEEEANFSEVSVQSQYKTKRFKSHNMKSHSDSSEEPEVDESNPGAEVTELKSLDQNEEPEKYPEYYPVSTEDGLKYGIVCYRFTAEEFGQLYSEELKNKILSLSHSIIAQLETNKNSALKIPFQSELIKSNYTVFKYMDKYIEICTLPREDAVTESPDSEWKYPNDDRGPNLPEPDRLHEQSEVEKKNDHKNDGIEYEFPVTGVNEQPSPSKHSSATAGQMSSSQTYPDEAFATENQTQQIHSYSFVTGSSNAYPIDENPQGETGFIQNVNHKGTKNPGQGENFDRDSCTGNSCLTGARITSDIYGTVTSAVYGDSNMHRGSLSTSNQAKSEHKYTKYFSSGQSSTINGIPNRVEGSIFRWNGTHLTKEPYPALKTRSCSCRRYETRKQMPLEPKIHSYREHTSGNLAGMNIPKTNNKNLKFWNQGSAKLASDDGIGDSYLKYDRKINAIPPRTSIRIDEDLRDRLHHVGNKRVSDFKQHSTNAGSGIRNYLNPTFSETYTLSINLFDRGNENTKQGKESLYRTIRYPGVLESSKTNVNHPSYLTTKVISEKRELGEEYQPFSEFSSAQVDSTELTTDSESSETLQFDGHTLYPAGIYKKGVYKYPLSI